ncbi:L-amino-acid oxidase isoform X2 [Sigmodon hispidus]
MISFCPVCGKSVKASFKFCPYCGKALPVEEHAGAQTGMTPLVSSFRGSRRELNSSSEHSPKTVKWSHSVTSPPPSLLSDYDSSESEDTLNSPEKATGTCSRLLTPRGSPQSSRLSPQTLKRSRVTISLQALPTGTKLTDKKGQHWTLGPLQTRDDQGILYEAEPTSVFPCESRTQKHRFSLKLDSKDGRLFNEQNFFQRAAKPVQVNKWKKQYLVPLLAIPTCVGFGVHQDKYRFLVACRLLDALEFLHESEYVHGNLTAENVFVNPEDLSQVTLVGYGFTFRYCPGGKHVTYQEGSRSPHEGDLEFISVDMHKGCGPSRRSDLQTLGYCMLKWLYGSLPWTSCLPNAEEISRQKQKCWDLWKNTARLVAILLGLAASLDWKTASGLNPFEKCMEDPDYDQLLKVVTLGLNRTLKPQKVVVIGAGVAGLTAAKVLSDAGHKVTVLEANNRIGGRIFTFRDGKTGWIGELGAMRMPSSHRILHKLCRSLGLNLTQFTQYDENTWTEVNDVKLRNYVVEKMPEKLGYDLNYRERGHSPEDIYQMALNKALQDLKILGCKNAMKKFNSHTLLEYLLGEGNLTQAAVQLLGDVMSKEGFFYLSFAEALRAHSCLSDRLRYSRIVGGWDLLPRALLSSLSGPVLLNAPVVAITQGISDVHVHIATSLQSRSMKVLTADVVLLTTSGPALQRITFSPPLTRRRQEALRALHYVAATKVFLSFRRPFWLEEHIEGGHSNTDRPARTIFYPAPGEGALLLASYTWSDAAAPFAGLSTDQTLRVVLKDVAAIHGPVVFRLWDGTGVVKRWAEDPHSQGGFVVQPPSFWQDKGYDWSLPYGRIYFAGEHTAHPHGWVETAVKSALRASVKINNHGFRTPSPEQQVASLHKPEFTEASEAQDQEEVSPSEQQEESPVFVEAVPELQEHVFVTVPQEKEHAHIHHEDIIPGHVHEKIIHDMHGYVHEYVHGGHKHMHGEAGHTPCKVRGGGTQPSPRQSSLQPATHSTGPQ